MPETRTLHKSHRARPRPPFEQIVLLLQGGGALGAYQGGVYQALAEANLHPDWVAGISIGAINCALIAGNPPEHRVDKLRAFWEAVSQSPLGLPYLSSLEMQSDLQHRLINQTRALGTLFFGAPGFFTPRLPPPYLYPPGAPQALSYYDTAPVIALLEALVDFDRLDSDCTRFSVGSVNVRTGNFVYFDNAHYTITPQHVIASGSLPPGFPPTEIEGEFYWDGGIVSNTPLQYVLDQCAGKRDTLAFQVDLWNARGELPRDLVEADLRQKEIRYSSRTRAGTDQFRRMQTLRRALVHVLKEAPAALRDSAEARLLAEEADEKVYNIIHLIYRSKDYEGACKDYEFSRHTMEEHWKSGYNDAVRTLRHPEVLQRPQSMDGVFTFDLAYQGRE